MPNPEQLMPSSDTVDARQFWGAAGSDSLTTQPGLGIMSGEVAETGESRGLEGRSCGALQVTDRLVERVILQWPVTNPTLWL